MAVLAACEPSYPENSQVSVARTATSVAATRDSAQSVAKLSQLNSAEVILPLAPTVTKTATAKPSLTPSPTATATATQTPTPTATNTPTQTPSPTATATNTPTPTATATSTPIPTPTLISGCADRIPSNDLLTIITRSYAVSRDYAPSDLLSLSDYFGVSVTLGYSTRVRSVLIDDLQALIAEMHVLGLSPTIISGYRSYSDQYVAWKKWHDQYPDRADILSAPPGTSEHQLGTTVDFGSPELDNEFHTHFYKTGEGAWLLENAHRYGFTLSYPFEAYAITQFFYEPWHYRYVGEELATMLYQDELSLTEYQLENLPEPCVSGR